MSMTIRTLLAVLLLRLAAPCSAGGGAAGPGGYNVVMILMETLRPDHLGCYGYGRATSPNIDKLASESAVFENAFAQSSQSLISAASIFTGLYPPSHGVTRADKRLDPAVPTLAGELKKLGYRTAAFTAGFFLNRSFGLDSGFERYDDSEDFGTLRDVLPGALKWLRGNRKKKFFLLVHSYDAHAPYRAPEEFLGKFSPGYDGPLKGLTLDYYLADRIYKDGLYDDFRLKKKLAGLEQKDIDHVVSQYDGAVLYADSYVGKLLAEIEKQGLKDRTLVLFMSSAGEALMDHGTIISSFHGGLYDEGIHVPLLIRVPGAKPSRVKSVAQLVDIMPTVLSLLGAAAPEAAQGRSLRPELGGDDSAPPDRPVYAQTLSLNTGLPYVGLRKYPWKLILEDGRYMLFDLAADPGERTDLYDKKPDSLELMSKELDRTISAMPRNKAPGGQRPLAVVIKRMRDMGYWWVDRPRVDSWFERSGGKEGGKGKPDQIWPN